MAWIFVIGLIAALVRVGGWLLDDTPAAPATRSRRQVRSTASAIAESQSAGWNP